MAKNSLQLRFSGFRLRVAFIICTNQFASPKNGHESLKYSTGLPFQTFRLFQKFFTGKTRKVVLHLLSKYNSRKYFPNGYKAPKYLLWLREAWQSATSPESHCLLFEPLPPPPAPLPSRNDIQLSPMAQNSLKWNKYCNIQYIFITDVLKTQWRIQTRGPGGSPPLYLYQTETKKKIRPPPSPPSTPHSPSSYLRVWMTGSFPAESC